MVQTYSNRRRWWAHHVVGFTAALGMMLAGAGMLAPPAHARDGESKCGEVTTSLIKCDDIDKYSKVGENEGGYIFDLLGFFIRILTTGVGIVAVGGIVYGAILYASAADNQAQVTKALEVIRNVVIGLVAYALMYVLIEFLIPGGLF